MKYVSIDIETTGLDPKKHQIIEFAAVIEDTVDIKPISELPRIRMLVVHNDYVSPYCLGLHKDLFQKLSKVKVYSWNRIAPDEYTCVPNCLMGLFSEWLRTNKFDISKNKVLVAGKNFNGFDAKFLNLLVKRIKFHHRALDPTTLFTLPTDKEPPSLALCAERAGLEFKGDGYHSALSDAIMVIELLRKGWGLKPKEQL